MTKGGRLEGKGHGGEGARLVGLSDIDFAATTSSRIPYGLAGVYIVGLLVDFYH